MGLVFITGACLALLLAHAAFTSGVQSHRRRSCRIKTLIKMGYIQTNISMKMKRESTENEKLFLSEFTQNKRDHEMSTKMAMGRHNLLSVAAALINVPAEVFTTPPMVDPHPPSTPEEYKIRKKITSLLSTGWSPTDGFQIPKEQVEELDNLMQSEGEGVRPSTYGEITELGSRQLFHYMGLTSTSIDKDESDLTFVDLGCGNGKLMMQAYMELPGVRHIHGIELASARYQSAILAWEKLKEKVTDLRLEMIESQGYEEGTAPADIDIHEGDLFNLDISAATHIYVASLCFTDSMMQRLAKKIIDEGGKLRVVATLKPFPEQFDKYLGLSRTEYLEMSW
eukprot:CAMPEP_0117744660 /NCGR_PEP_ID=MMETSP0947-20121206/6897_1 /TAXON_ID=44440 /ORGANISM="Chattonella subsalsa, Strain CCMP2191" /LENGTH=338 /DNA_ID=CAMNT_0005561663 /DNA_START=60 /DNA_END=1073 /DNA_ORIENTATION=-